MMPHEADLHATALASALRGNDRVSMATCLGLLSYLCSVSIKARKLMDQVKFEAMEHENQPLLNALVDAGLLDMVDILGS